MPICSYLVVPETGARHGVARSLAALPGCEVEAAENRDVLLLVTDTPSPDEDERLMARVEAVPGIQALVLCFGEIDPDTTEGDPLARVKRGRGRELPVLPARPDEFLAAAASSVPTPRDS